MNPLQQASPPAPDNMRYFRVTPCGALGLCEPCPYQLSRHQRDILEMCRMGIWWQELRQFVPPRSLEESLQVLQALGLVECLEQGLVTAMGRLPPQSASRTPMPHGLRLAA